MAEKAINPLRRRMIEDMTIRNFDRRTEQSYFRAMPSCRRYWERRPDQLTFEDVLRYQLRLGQSGLAPSSINVAMTALRFFFRVTLRRAEAVDYIPIAPLGCVRSSRRIRGATLLGRCICKVLPKSRLFELIAMKMTSGGFHTCSFFNRAPHHHLGSPAVA